MPAETALWRPDKPPFLKIKHLMKDFQKYNNIMEGYDTLQSFSGRRRQFCRIQYRPSKPHFFPKYSGIFPIG